MFINKCDGLVLSPWDYIGQGLHSFITNPVIVQLYGLNVGIVVRCRQFLGEGLGSFTFNVVAVKIDGCNWSVCWRWSGTTKAFIPFTLARKIHRVKWLYCVFASKAPPARAFVPSNWMKFVERLIEVIVLFVSSATAQTFAPSHWILLLRIWIEVIVSLFPMQPTNPVQYSFAMNVIEAKTNCCEDCLVCW